MSVHLFYVFWEGLKKLINCLLPSFVLSDVSKSLRSLTKNERCQQIAQIAHQQWANEPIAHFIERISSFAHGNNRAIRSKKPMSKFPTLLIPGTQISEFTLLLYVTNDQLSPIPGTQQRSLRSWLISRWQGPNAPSYWRCRGRWPLRTDPSPPCNDD